MFQDVLHSNPVDKMVSIHSKVVAAAADIHTHIHNMEVEVVEVVEVDIHNHILDMAAAVEAAVVVAVRPIHILQDAASEDAPHQIQAHPTSGVPHDNRAYYSLSFKIIPDRKLLISNMFLYPFPCFSSSGTSFAEANESSFP